MHDVPGEVRIVPGDHACVGMAQHLRDEGEWDSFLDEKASGGVADRMEVDRW